MKKLILGAVTAAILTTGALAEVALKGHFTEDGFQIENINELKKVPIWLSYYDLRKDDNTRHCVKATKYFALNWNRKISDNVELVDVLKEYTYKTQANNYSGKMTLVKLYYKDNGKEQVGVYKFWTKKEVCDQYAKAHNAKLGK